MVRNSRNTLRLFFVLVIVAAIFGAWFADTFWRIDLLIAQTPAMTEEINWVDTAAMLSEEVLQFLLGWTSGGQ